MTGEPRPDDSGEGGDKATQPLTPEQERRNRAGMIYMRYLSAGLEGHLVGGEYYRIAQLPTQGRDMPEMMLIASGNERGLSIHSIPDEAGVSREYRYNTVLGGIGYAINESESIQVQVGSPEHGAATGPLEQDDLIFLDSLLTHRMPVPEVIQSARNQVNAVMQPPQQMESQQG